MKNLFVALALTAFVGASAVNTVSAIGHSKVTVGGGEECKKDKKCKKGSACCKAPATAGTATATTTGATEEKKCSKDGSRKCCSSAASKPATVTPEVTNDVKPAK